MITKLASTAMLAAALLIGRRVATAAGAQPHDETKYHWCSAQFRGNGGEQLVITDETFSETHAEADASKVERAILKQFRAKIEDDYDRKFPDASCRHYSYDRIQAELQRSQTKILFAGAHGRDSIHEVSFSFDAPDGH